MKWAIVVRVRRIFLGLFFFSLFTLFQIKMYDTLKACCGLTFIVGLLRNHTHKNEWKFMHIIWKNAIIHWRIKTGVRFFDEYWMSMTKHENNILKNCLQFPKFSIIQCDFWEIFNYWEDEGKNSIINSEYMWRNRISEKLEFPLSSPLNYTILLPHCKMLIWIFLGSYCFS